MNHPTQNKKGKKGGGAPRMSSIGLMYFSKLPAGVCLVLPLFCQRYYASKLMQRLTLMHRLTLMDRDVGCKKEKAANVLLPED